MSRLRIVTLVGLSALLCSVWTASAASYRVVPTHTNFGALFALAVDPSGNLYVDDQRHYAILKLSPTGHLLLRDPMGQKCGISGVAAAPTGDVYAVSNCQALVSHFSPTGRLLGRFGRISLLGPGTNGVVADGRGHVYVTYSSSAGVPVRRGGKPRTGGKLPPLPPALAGRSLIREFTTNAVLLRTIPLSGVHQAFGIAVDSLGNLYVTASEALLKISPAGRVIARWTIAASRAQLLPNQPAVDGQGNVYTTDVSGNIIKVSAASRMLGTIVRHGIGPGFVQQASGEAVDRGGDLFVADEGPNRIKEFSLTGRLVAVWTP